MFPNVNIKTDGKKGVWMFSGSPFYHFTKTELASSEGNTEVYRYISESPSFYVESKQERFGRATKITNTVYSEDDEPIKLTQVSSFLACGLSDEGEMKWYDPKRFTVYFARSTWQGEAQWQKSTLQDLGLIMASNHVTAAAAKFHSIGSMSTSEYHPIIIIEDHELKKAHFFELEGAYSWYMEIGVRGGEKGESLYVEGNCAYSNNDGFLKTLRKGESFTAAPGVFGVTDGTFEDAVRELTVYKRATSVADLPNKIPLAGFNNYMNGMWVNPTDKELIPMIDAAADCGCELFCIDAGWYMSPQPSFEQTIGDWEWNDERFGDYGFAGIIEYIAKKGMLPGIWLEIETCGAASKNAKLMEDCLLRQNGELINPDRMFFDFTKKKVRDFLEGVIDRMYSVGVRFIKNDYNHTIGIGADGGEYPGEKLRATIDAFYDFIDRIQAKYPDLIIENCSSGGMRSDNGTLKHFQLESLSDQEYYYMNPSILSGSLACYPPEKAGIWSYPYPFYYEDRFGDCKEYMEKNADKFADGEETAFNMACSMLGAMYLSGRIEFADELNYGLVKESVTLYKKIRHLIPASYPCYPDGIPFRISDEGWFTVPLLAKEEKTMILGVFKIGSAKGDSAEFDLSRYVGTTANITEIYPTALPTDYTWTKGKLKISSDKEYIGRLFVIEY